MNEMYNMGLSIHSIGTIILLGVLLFNIVIIQQSSSYEQYKRLHSIFLLPLNATILGVALFTGVIMMAAKHLDFTLANLAMIFVSLVLLYLEKKRTHALVMYKTVGVKILAIEILLILLIASWMWLS